MVALADFLIHNLGLNPQPVDCDVSDESIADAAPRVQFPSRSTGTSCKGRCGRSAAVSAARSDRFIR
jgi:hypothetical protein